MFGLKGLRFVDVGTGLSMIFGTAGVLVASALHAAEPGCAAPPACRPTIQGGGCCDKLFEDAAGKLKNLNAGCTTAGPACCAPTGNCTTASNCCDKIYDDAAQKLKNLNPSCCSTGGGSCVPSAPVCEPSSVFGDTGCGLGLFTGELGEQHLLINMFNDECGGNPLKDNGWVLGGHSQWGYQSRPDGAFAGNGPFVNQREYGRPGLNQAYLFAGKVANGSEGLGLGFRIDGMYGLDGNEGQAFGNVNAGHWDYLNGWDHGAYEFALPQLYVEAAYHDFSVKAGHFYTPVGYEVVPSTGNFFLSRTLTFYNSEPFTHTGALTSYKLNDKVTVLNGATFGMDSGFYQYQSAFSYLGGVTYTINENTVLTYAMTAGDLGSRGDGSINSAYITRKWGDKFSTVHQFDVLSTNLIDPATGNGANFADPTQVFPVPKDSIGLINYAFYDVTSKVKAGIRSEWFKADGISYYTMTYGVNIKPTANLTVRPEIRQMWSPGNNQSYLGPQYHDQLFNQTVYGIDAIYAF